MSAQVLDREVAFLVPKTMGVVGNILLAYERLSLEERLRQFAKTFPVTLLFSIKRYTLSEKDNFSVRFSLVSNAWDISEGVRSMSNVSGIVNNPLLNIKLCTLLRKDKFSQSFFDLFNLFSELRSNCLWQ